MSMSPRAVGTPKPAPSLGLVGDLGRVQQRLGRDAAPVQAGAPDLVLLDKRDPLPQLARAQRAGVTPAAAAEDDDVVAVPAQAVIPSLAPGSRFPGAPRCCRPGRRSRRSWRSHVAAGRDRLPAALPVLDRGLVPDVADGDAAPDKLPAGGLDVGDDQAGGPGRAGTGQSVRPTPIWTEQAEPGGVSWTTRESPAGW